MKGGIKNSIGAYFATKKSFQKIYGAANPVKGIGKEAYSAFDDSSSIPQGSLLVLDGKNHAALVLATQATGARPAPITTSYVVGSLTIPGVSTGLVLADGQQVKVTATGSMCPWGDVNPYCVGPDGDATWATTDSWYGGYLLPGAPAWGLVGRVGNGPWVHVGSGPTMLSGTGEVEFAVNDDLFPDNTNNFVVNVTSCWPGWGNGDDKHQHCGPPGQAKDKPTG